MRTDHVNILSRFDERLTVACNILGAGEIFLIINRRLLLAIKLSFLMKIGALFVNKLESDAHSFLRCVLSCCTLYSISIFLNVHVIILSCLLSCLRRIYITVGDH